MKMNTFVIVILAASLGLVSGCAAPQTASGNHNPSPVEESQAEASQTSVPSGKNQCGPGDAITDVTAGGPAACAAVDGQTVCWGLLVPLLAGAPDTSVPPTLIGGPPNVVRVSTNGQMLFAVDSRGALFRWNAKLPVVKLLEEGVRDVMVGPDLSSLCLKMKDGGGQCYQHKRWMNGGSFVTGPLPEPTWSSPDVVDFSFSGWLVCALVKNQGIECIDGTRIDGVGVGVFVDYKTACLIRAEGPPICNQDARQGFQWRSPVFATTGTSDARWGLCQIDAEGQVDCKFANRTTRADGCVPTELVVGKNFACTLCGDQVSCWGESANTWIGRASGLRGPVQSVGVANASQVFVLPRGSCAELSSGDYTCWGEQGFQGPISQMPDELRQNLERLESPDPRVACEIQNGRVLCKMPWNRVKDHTGAWGESPIEEIVGVHGALELYQNGDAVCARTRNDLFCWFFDQKPLRLPVKNPRSIAVGTLGDVCVVAEDGTLNCALVSGRWSPLAASLLKTNEVLQPTLGLKNVKHVALGLGHGCVVHDSGTVSCFGDPTHNALGDGGTFVAEPFAIPLSTTD